MGVGSARVSIALLLLLASCTDAPPEPTPAEPSGPPASAAVSPSPKNDKAALQEVGRFDSPIHVAAPPDDERLFIVEQAGKVKVFAEGKVLDRPFIDIVADVGSGGERGLFSIAFAPDYQRSGLAYLSYTNTSGDSRVTEYKVDAADPNRLDPGSKREILAVVQPFANHNGGLIVFDRTGKLIVGLGDGGSAGDPGNRAQDLSTMLGKLLRIDPRTPSDGKPYGIPKDNPFVNRSGVLPEILAYGLRNPWRFSFDDVGNLYLGDVGQNRFEEINYVTAAQVGGSNFGWRVYEGNERFKNEAIDESRLVRPILTYGLGGGACAVTGGHVHTGQVDSLKGWYLWADHCKGDLMAGRMVEGKLADQRDLGLKAERLSSFGQDSKGESYVASLSGAVYRIISVPA